MKKILILLLLFTYISFLFAETGKLEEFENELKKPLQNEHEHEDENKNEIDDDFDEEDEDKDNFCNQLFWYLFYNVFIGSEPLDYYRFQSLIYQNDYSGRYSIDGVSYGAEVEIKYIHNSKKLNGISLNGNFFFLNAFNLKLLFQNFEEVNENTLDKMKYYEIFINYYRCRLPGLNWYWGFGAKGLDRTNKYLGPALNSGIEIYPMKPLSIDLGANIGWLNAHPVSKLNAGVKVHYWKFMLSSEFQRLQTGSSKINSINIGFGFNF